MYKVLVTFFFYYYYYYYYYLSNQTKNKKMRRFFACIQTRNSSSVSYESTNPRNILKYIHSFNIFQKKKRNLEGKNALGGEVLFYYHSHLFFCFSGKMSIKTS